MKYNSYHRDIIVDFTILKHDFDFLILQIQVIIHCWSLYIRHPWDQTFVDYSTSILNLTINNINIWKFPKMNKLNLTININVWKFLKMLSFIDFQIPIQTKKRITIEYDITRDTQFGTEKTNKMVSKEFYWRSKLNKNKKDIY